MKEDDSVEFIELCKTCFDYDPDTGVFVNKVTRSNNAKVGEIATCTIKKSGYAVFNINFRQYQAHRVAWLYVHGVWPKGVIDHIDGDPRNNRIANLRDVTHAVNIQNQRRARSDNKLNVLGVIKDKRSGKYIAQIMANRKCYRIGRFDTPELAHAAYIAAKVKHHPDAAISIAASTTKEPTA